MSQKTLIKLKRRDKLYKLNSCINIFDINELSSIDKQYHMNILRIMKKAILGSNYCYSYSKNNIFASAIANFIIINTCFVILPQIIFNSLNIIQSNEEIGNLSEEEEKALLINIRNEFFFRLTISNFIDIPIFVILGILYKFKERKINKYMKKYTQYAIKEENDILNKNKIFCKISSDDFDIEIKKSKKKLNNKNNKEEYFFKYVINFPNLRRISNFLYSKSFNQKEKEIINNINYVCDEIDFKYKKKLIKFIIVIISVFSATTILFLLFVFIFFFIRR